MSNQINVVEFIVSVCVRLQPIYPFYQHAFPNQCDPRIGIRLTAMPSVPHLLFFRRCHVIPLFGAGELSVSIEKESTFIYDCFRNLAAERDIRARNEVGEQCLCENLAIQKRLIAKRHPDPFRVGRLEC